MEHFLTLEKKLKGKIQELQEIIAQKDDEIDLISRLVNKDNGPIDAMSIVNWANEKTQAEKEAGKLNDSEAPPTANISKGGLLPGLKVQKSNFHKSMEKKLKKTSNESFEDKKAENCFNDDKIVPRVIGEHVQALRSQLEMMMNDAIPGSELDNPNRIVDDEGERCAHTYEVLFGED